MTTNFLSNTLNNRLGSDTKFPINGNFQELNGLDVLLQDIQILLLTNLGERVFRPTFGCELQKQTWENIDAAAINGTYNIKTAITKYEPRINLISVTPTINRDTGLIIFSLNFVIKNTDTSVNLVFPYRTGTNLSQV